MIRKLARKKHALLAATVLSTLPFAAGGGAEAADSENIQTRDVVVTASRTEQELKETPTAAEVITREELERTGANTLTEALKRSANINVTQSAMGNNVSLRGMNNNQTLILINGRRIRTEDTNDSANKYELNRVNMANVDHIEIIRGAASSLYGSEAMGGVINIVTRKMLEDAVSHQHDIGFVSEKFFVNHPDADISKMALDLVSDRYQLSKYHSKTQTIVTDDHRLKDLGTEITTSYKYAFINEQMKEVMRQMQDPAVANDQVKCAQAIQHYTELREILSNLAKRLGERVILSI